MRENLFMPILTIIGLASLIAYADDSDIDRAICNGDEICILEMKLDKINEDLNNTKENLQMATKSLQLMEQYNGMWAKTEESRDWYQMQKEFVCATNEKARQRLIQIKSELEALHSSSQSDISNQAKLKLEDLQKDPYVQFFLTENPCAQAKQLCKKFL